MRTFLTIALATALLTACDFPGIFDNDDRNLPDGNGLESNLLSVEITGGFAGVNQTLVVDESGKLVFCDDFFPGANWTQRLTQQELDGLKTLMRSNNFELLADEYIDGQVADAFLYAISYQGKVVRTDNFAAPQNLKNIIAGILELIDATRLNGLELALELSADQVRSGESVEMTLAVTNTGTSALTLHFIDGQIFDFQALAVQDENKDLVLVWNWAHDMAFTDALWNLTLQAGDSRSYQITWDGTDNSGNAVTGTFIIRAQLVSSPGGSPPQKTLTIRD